MCILNLNCNDLNIVHKDYKRLRIVVAIIGLFVFVSNFTDDLNNV